MAAAVTETRCWIQACFTKAGQTISYCSQRLTNTQQTVLHIHCSTLNELKDQRYCRFVVGSLENPHVHCPSCPRLLALFPFAVVVPVVFLLLHYVPPARPSKETAAGEPLN